MRVRVDVLAGVALTVVVTGAADGPVHVMLYNGSEGFPIDLDAAERVALGRLEGGRASITFDDVPAGTWAVSAFLDTDRDGVLDAGWFGIPKEPVGATSNGTGWGIGPPSFSGSSFVVGAEPTVVTVALVDI